MITYREYIKVTQELKKALNNNDLFWLTRESNRYLCQKLMSYWNTLYSKTKETKYLYGRKYLRYILKMSKNRDKWEKFSKDDVKKYFI